VNKYIRITHEKGLLNDQTFVRCLFLLSSLHDRSYVTLYHCLEIVYEDFVVLVLYDG